MDVFNQVSVPVFLMVQRASKSSRGFNFVPGAGDTETIVQLYALDVAVAVGVGLYIEVGVLVGGRV